MSLVPTFITVLAPRFSTVPLPFRSSVMASWRSARRFSSSGLGSSSPGTRRPAGRHSAPTFFTVGAGVADTAGTPRVVPRPAATTRLNSPADFFRTVPPSTAIVSREGASEKEHGQSRAQWCGWHLRSRVHVGATCRGDPSSTWLRDCGCSRRQFTRRHHGAHKGLKPGQGVMFVRLHIHAQTVRHGRGQPVSVSTASLIRSSVVRMPAASSWSWPAAPPMTGPSTAVPG